MANKFHNIARYDKVATTIQPVAKSRAEYAAVLDIRTVIELCVGPSLDTLQNEYNKFGIEVIGNDVDMRWHDSKHSWRMGDALTVDIYDVDAAVFAPPLSRGCSGKREDALMIEEVTPRFDDFLSRTDLPKVVVLVCPARSLATTDDVCQLFKLRHQALKKFVNVEIVPQYDARGKCRKYVELWCSK